MKRTNLLVGVLLLATGCGDMESMSSASTTADAGLGHAAADGGGSSARSDSGTPGPPSSPDPWIQAGTLTAGSFDDHYFGELFDEFVAKMGTVAAAHVKERALIQVVDQGGKPVTDARVVVKQQGQALLSLFTGSNGQALFFPELDGGGATGALEISAERDGVSASRVVELKDAPWRLLLNLTAAPPAQADIAFLVDATGSMADEIEFLKVETESIVQQVQARFSNLALRFALIVYRDQGDEYVTRTFDFADLTTFRQNLAAQQANGGGDTPEAVEVALSEATRLSWRLDGRARMLFHIADAPPHDQSISTALGVLDTFRTKGVRVYPIAASGVEGRAELVMRVAAFKTMARYIFLTNDSGYGGDHADPSIPPHTPTQTQQVACYNIEKLNSLIVRMISSELAGKVLAPTPQEVLKVVGTPQDGICDPAEAAQ